MAQRYEKRPLTEVIDKRKEFYQIEIGKVINAVYRGNLDLELIEGFEQLVLKLNRAKKEGKLETVVTKLIGSNNRKTRKPKLTFGLYIEAKENELTNEEIKEKFRVTNHQQLGGFAVRYNNLKKRK